MLEVKKPQVPVKPQPRGTKSEQFKRKKVPHGACYNNGKFRYFKFTCPQGEKKENKGGYKHLEQRGDIGSYRLDPEDNIFFFKDVFYASGMHRNLISVPSLMKKGLEIRGPFTRSLNLLAPHYPKINPLFSFLQITHQIGGNKNPTLTLDELTGDDMKDDDDEEDGGSSNRCLRWVGRYWKLSGTVGGIDIQYEGDINQSLFDEANKESEDPPTGRASPQPIFTDINKESEDAPSGEVPPPENNRIDTALEAEINEGEKVSPPAKELLTCTETCTQREDTGMEITSVVGVPSAGHNTETQTCIDIDYSSPGATDSHAEPFHSTEGS
ncbi:uncharacterized protein LOC109846134 [Asparagus officinalis]|uniref:uncharacterized protein LOC109846134 n=1 Tax=Asparagus officinalis TaxID=4686 RepID=UPI00098E033D|nr:uncharacterized protein LOC109846134 [Asparagus officinalis]